MQKKRWRNFDFFGGPQSMKIVLDSMQEVLSESIEFVMVKTVV